MDAARVLFLLVVWLSNLMQTQSLWFGWLKGDDGAIASLHKECELYPWAVKKYVIKRKSAGFHTTFDRDNVKVIGCWENHIKDYKLVLAERDGAFRAVLYNEDSSLASMDVVNRNGGITSLREDLLKSVSITEKGFSHYILFIMNADCRMFVLKFYDLGKFDTKKTSCPWKCNRDSPRYSDGYSNGWKPVLKLPNLPGYDEVTIREEL